MQNPNQNESDETATPSDNPWVKFAGMFKDDPYFDEWQEAIAENRRRIDAEPDTPLTS